MSYQILKKQIPKKIHLIGVSKYHTIDDIKKLYSEGLKDFGESRVQEAIPKIEALPKDIHWHFIGTLQKNKVKQVVQVFQTIHSVDSFSLLELIDKVAHKKDHVQTVFLQVNTSLEKSKHGFSAQELQTLYPQMKHFQNIKILGLMTMAPLTEDKEKIRACFNTLKKLADSLALKSLSMGMSSDYTLAIEEGATHLRIGKLLFEESNLIDSI